MKEMVSVFSNPFYTQKDEGNLVTLTPSLELVIVHTDGKEYEISDKSELVSNLKLTEVRLIVNPIMLAELITDLQLHQKKLEGITKNANQINSLIKHISTPVKDAGDDGIK